MIGPALVVSALASAVVAWGVPDSIVEGDTTREIVGRIIRRHINEVKYCYEQELLRQPDLVGKIDVQFTVAVSGQVSAAAVQRSTIGNARVEGCTVAAVRRWQFPPPFNGGTAIITYPFVLTPEHAITIVAGTNGAGAVEIEPINSTLPTVFVHRATDANLVSSNGLVAVMESGLLLVDTAWTDTQTEAVLAWGDGRFHRPWIGAVITHDHADRAGGIGALERRHIPVAALDLTVAKLAGRGVSGVTTLFLARDGAFTDPRGFEAFYPGPGHASDNIVLRFPGLVFGGCLVKSMTASDLGFTGDANLAAWPVAISNVRARYADTVIVPGHGGVDGSGQAYQHTLDLLAAAKGRNAAKK
jgi:metallo-beta-lactamase class B